MNNIEGLCKEIDEIFSNCPVEQGKIKAVDFIDAIILKFPENIRSQLREEIKNKLDPADLNPFYTKRELVNIFKNWIKSSMPSSSLSPLSPDFSRLCTFASTPLSRRSSLPKKTVSKKCLSISFADSSSAQDFESLNEEFELHIPEFETSQRSAHSSSATMSLRQKNIELSNRLSTTELLASSMESKYQEIHNKCVHQAEEIESLKFEVRKYKDLQKRFDEMIDCNRRLEQELKEEKEENKKLNDKHQSSVELLDSYKKSQSWFENELKSKVSTVEELNQSTLSLKKQLAEMANLLKIAEQHKISQTNVISSLRSEVTTLTTHCSILNNEVTHAKQEIDELMQKLENHNKDVGVSLFEEITRGNNNAVPPTNILGELVDNGTQTDGCFMDLVDNGIQTDGCFMELVDSVTQTDCFFVFHPDNSSLIDDFLRCLGSFFIFLLKFFLSTFMFFFFLVLFNYFVNPLQFIQIKYYARPPV